MSELRKCMSILNSDYESCPGRFCGRILLNDTSCIFSECQVAQKKNNNKQLHFVIEIN